MIVEQEANRLFSQMSFAELREYERRLTEKIYELKLNDLQEYRKLIPTVSRMIHIHGHMNALIRQVNKLLAEETNGNGEEELKCRTLLSFWELPLHIALIRCLYLKCKVPVVDSKLLTTPLEVTCYAQLRKISVESLEELERIFLLEKEFEPTELSVFEEHSIKVAKLNNIWENIELSLNNLIEEADFYKRLSPEMPKNIKDNIENQAIKYLNERLSKKQPINANIFPFISSSADYSLPSSLIIVDEDPFYYASLSTSNIESLNQLREKGIHGCEQKVQRDLADCVDIFDVFAVLHAYALSAHDIMDYVQVWCKDEHDWDVSSIRSFTFGQVPPANNINYETIGLFTVPDESITERFSFN